MGSVKDLQVLKEPERDNLGLGRFIFSDRYSVFDYGEMPDKINGKGASLCLISAYFFERLEKENVANHYVGIVEGDKAKRLEELESPSNIMEVQLVRVIKPLKVNGYDYSPIKAEKANYLIPLEVIYRNVLPEGSSVFRRLEKGLITPEQLGLEGMPKPGQKLDKPIIEASTKLESEDRYITWEEAKEISGLSEEEIEELKSITMSVNEIITKVVSKVGIVNEDGKLEFAFDEKRRLMVVDAIGTPDECRFSFEGMQISKEVLRHYYRRTDWYRRVEALKGQPDWREKAGTPPRLPEELRMAVSEMYMACCNEITGIRFFDVDSLKEVVKKLKELMQVSA
ncbi:phosphoribosylaminoimidazolesuccinocarboxamide synthase [Archaeoglobus veneficus]|uniref:Phosphoribosylaminoimidazole-succinocarboxamide synthase n=1 Tax=Archaeoglobus veneficus (strain DSM 11195 / SNP6) TaxID=693661 RepID=F2KPL0_ARCVS|nr:phosphoribosylaminoimidazolesuccinocarboxamide synthase [Archaeoglobus veneficus]AEA47538.1 phosphoribosylaminoimidazole-succinocarboxamide synthase [Archaeoglobus veneficus SNP6]